MKKILTLMIGTLMLFGCSAPSGIKKVHFDSKIHKIETLDKAVEIIDQDLKRTDAKLKEVSYCSIAEDPNILTFCATFETGPNADRGGYNTNSKYEGFRFIFRLKRGRELILVDRGY